MTATLYGRTAAGTTARRSGVTPAATAVLWLLLLRRSSHCRQMRCILSGRRQAEGEQPSVATGRAGERQAESLAERA
jgi:hypothetical protein